MKPLSSGTSRARWRAAAGAATLLAALSGTAAFGAVGASAENNGPTQAAALKPAHINSTNPGFQSGDCPGDDSLYGWHFVLQGKDTTFHSISVTFEKAGVVTTFVAHPDYKHAYVFTAEGDKLLGATAQVHGDDTEFNLSHVCSPTTKPTTTTTAAPTTTTTAAPTTTTTAAPTTTTTAAPTTTTTVAPTTTTTAAPTTTTTAAPTTTTTAAPTTTTTLPTTTTSAVAGTTTSSIPEETTTTTVEDETTTTTGAVAGTTLLPTSTTQAVAGTTIVRVRAGTLPVTGNGTLPLVIFGMSLLGAGFCLVRSNRATA